MHSLRDFLQNSLWEFNYSLSVRSETSGFLMFSGGMEKDQWHEMGYTWHKKYLPNIRVIFIEDP